MCGITGFYSFDDAFSESELNLMTNSIAHRGPDACGYYIDNYVGLGHRRLSIIDLSDVANQPMHSADNRYVMVYNGEVYNYQEIAEELKKNKNIDFRTTSDSEVILEAYAQYGPSFVSKLNGMFAIAIYDKQKNKLFVCRDRVGIKPLFYFWDGASFAFASELKALTCLKKIPLEVDRNAVYQFLHVGFIPAPISIYKSIKKVESGTWFIVSKNKLEQQKYWKATEKITKHILTNEQVAKTQLTDLLLSSVRYQIKSDVPFGVFLSGGIDSSLITANAVNVSDSKVNTFSIGFEENRYNESEHAKAIANHLNTNHHEFIVSYKDAIELIDSLDDVYSEPFSDSSSIPTMLVSKLAKKHVTVALSGDGGDELFLGYGAYKWAERLNNPLIKTFSSSISSILANTSKFQRHASYFKTISENLRASHILSQEQNCFSAAELTELLSSEFSIYTDSKKLESFDKFGNEINQLARLLKPSEKQAFFDLHFYLQEDLLTKVDRASMHYSLETRVPYLDHRIIEFALNVSPDLKIKNGQTKYLLKEILHQYIPKKLFDRPKKGFSIPLEKWLKNELYFLIDENLSKEVIGKYGFVTFENVEQLKNDFLNGKNYLYNRIWLLIVMHKWLRKNVQN